MIEFLQRLQEHAAQLSEKLESEGAGGDLVTAAISLGKVVSRFCWIGFQAMKKGESIAPAIESLVDDGPAVLFELSAAMPSLADVLFDPETWHRSVLEIGDSATWNQTTEIASSVIDRFVSECIDILMQSPDAREFDVVENLGRAEKALTELIELYLLPLVE